MSYAELYETETAAAEPPAVEKTNAIAAGIVGVQTEVAKFDQIAAGLAAIEAAHPKNVIVAAIDTSAGMKLAEVSWRAYRNPRLEVERARKAAKAPVLELGKAIDTFAGSLEDRLRAGEDHYKGQIDAEKARHAAIKAEQERIEAEKAAAHVARLVLLGSYLTRCQEPGMTAERIERGLCMLAYADVSDPDEARAAKLVEVRDGVKKTMQVLHAQAVAREAEAARQEAIRIENARVAAELAAERERIAAEAAEVRRQQAALDARRAEDARVAALALQHEQDAAAESARIAREAADRALLASEEQAKAGAAAALSATQAAADVQGPSGTPAGHLMQDVSSDLSQALASKPDAMLRAREAAAAIEAAHAAPPTELQALAAEARASKFPSEPKMGKAWWARFFSLADACHVE